jgi:phosphopantothenoylcysteine decarboxylase/phosphopantothenate--cysteine ligase
MHCVVTAGPTYEKLDDVRRMTNFSTGRLGIELAGHLTAAGHEVTLLVGEQATWPGERRATRVQTFATTNDLLQQLARLAGDGVGAVFHVAAVSDFAFGRILERSEVGELREVKAGKLSTRDGTLLAELVPTPKLIARLREFFPGALLVGWKFEVDGDRAAVLAKARVQMEEYQTDACVANGRAYGAGFGLVLRDGTQSHCEESRRLFDRLVELLVTNP